MKICNNNMVCKEMRIKRRCVYSLLLYVYLFLILGSTVFFRTYNNEVGHNFTPFWSYAAISGGRDDLIVENALNLLMLLPVGFLLGLSLKYVRWWQVLCVGIVSSTFIEVLQFFWRRGFSEFDDIIHNTIGCMIGYGLYRLVLACQK